MRMLLVEDDAVLADGLLHSLRRSGNAVDWAKNGVEADVALGNQVYDLAILDLGLPKLDGFEVLRRLRHAGLQTAILSNGSPEMLEAAVGSAGIGNLLDDILSVESIGRFKPAPEVYELATKRFDCARNEVLFVSSNGWDAACAAGYTATAISAAIPTAVSAARSAPTFRFGAPAGRFLAPAFGFRGAAARLGGLPFGGEALLLGDAFGFLLLQPNVVAAGAGDENHEQHAHRDRDKAHRNRSFAA